MTTIRNQITIHSPAETVWNNLTRLELLEKYDPTVSHVRMLTEQKTGIGAARRVTMSDGKNWFEERVTVFVPGEALTFELFACSFPVNRLKRRYTFAPCGETTVVSQVMEYEVKYGVLGRLPDALFIRRNSDRDIKNFLPD